MRCRGPEPGGTETEGGIVGGECSGGGVEFVDEELVSAEIAGDGEAAGGIGVDGVGVGVGLAFGVDAGAGLVDDGGGA